MPLDDKTAEQRLQSRTLALLLLAASLALGWVLLPLYGPILWGAVLALLFTPWHRRLLARLGRQRTLAALLTLLAVSVIVILPMVLVAAAVANEAAALFERVQSGEVSPARYFGEIFAALPQWVRDLLARFGMVNFTALQRKLDVALMAGSRGLATRAFGIGQNTFEFVLGLSITLYLAFFLLRDGAALLRVLRRVLPLPQAQQQALLDSFGTVVRATVNGNLLVALAQGALGGLAFWFLGVEAALLWALLMAFVSLLPAVGAALVWLPVALYFLASGATWQGLALLAWGVLVIGLVDNLLRPMLVGRATGLPDWVVMLSTLGGLAVLGLHGFVLGPAIAALFVAVWRLHLGPQPAP